MRLPVRQFDFTPAVRAEVPCLVGLFGPSNSGKTFSALRLAKGMSSVNGGSIAFIDTEAKRALHYAPYFKFHHAPMSAPFGPLDYAAAIKAAIALGAKNIIIDSMSHEHEGEGGVLWQHDEVVEEKGKAHDKIAWVKPKREREYLKQTLTQHPGINFILCFRAKRKLRYPKKGEPSNEPQDLGWMPITGDIIFEMTVCGLLLPSSEGVAQWSSLEPGEQQMIKVPLQFRALQGVKGKQITEKLGEEFATWARGGAPMKEQAATTTTKKEEETI